MRIILVRHGESLANIKGDNSDNEFTPLTDLGKEQAVKTGKFLLLNYNIKKIISSPFKRTMNTAELIANELKISQVDTDDNLIESHNGILNGVKLENISSIKDTGPEMAELIKYLSNVTMIQRTKKEEEFINSRNKLIELSKSETDDELFARVRKIIKLMDHHTTENIDGDLLLVSHNGTIKYLLEELFNIDANGLGNIYGPSQAKNCHISVIKKDKKTWFMELQLYTGHL